MALVVAKTTGGHEYKFKDLSQAPTIARYGASVFAWKDETHEEYWWWIKRALDCGAGGSPDLIVDGGGGSTLLINEGVKAEEIYSNTGQSPDPSSSTDKAELQTLVGVSEKITIAVERIYQMQANETRLFPAISVSDSVTRSKFIHLYDCRYVLPDGIMRATNMMIIPGKKVVVSEYDDGSEGLKQAGADVVVYEVDPKHSLQAFLRVSSSVKTLDEDVVSEADIFVTIRINKSNIGVDLIKKMKNKVVIYNMDLILELNSMVLRNTVNPSFLLWSKRGTDEYETKINVLSEHLEEVSDLRLETIEEETKGEAYHVFDMKRISEMVVQASSLFGMAVLRVIKASKVSIVVVQASSLFGMAVLRVIKASKVSIDLTGPTVTIDFPLAPKISIAIPLPPIWG